VVFQGADELKKYRWEWLLLGLVLAVAAVNFLFFVGHDFAGVTPVTPRRAAIVGVWTNTDGATLDFSSDGTVEVRRMPVIDDSSIGDQLPGNGAGTWQIEPWESNIGTGGGVAVTTGDGGVELTTTGDLAHPKLFAYLGDPDEDNEFVFTKQG
jgi:hypothetical protein